MMNTKKLLLISTLTLILLSLLILSGCSNSSTQNAQSADAFVIKKAGSFSPAVCAAKGLTGKAVMLESRYCPHCTATLPDFKQACDESGFPCEILDISQKENINKMYSYGVAVQFTPTFIIDCDYFVGAKTFDEYFDLLSAINVNDAVINDATNATTNAAATTNN